MALNFAIKVNADASSADKAASSVQRLDATLRQESRTLSILESQMKSLSRAGSVDIETGRKLGAAIDSQKNKVAGLTQSLISAGGAGFGGAAEKASALDGVIGELGGKLTGAAGTLGRLGPYGVAAAAGLAVLTGGVLALSGAIGFLGSKLVSLGVQASEAKGDVTRSLELLYGGEKAAQHTYKVLESLTGDIAISQGRVMELADTLTKAGQVNGDAMVRSIAAIGKAEAVRKGAGQVIEGVITRSQQARMFSISRSELMQVGLSYRDLAKEISKGTGMAVGDAELRLRTGGVQLKAGLTALTSVIDSKMGDIAQKKFMTVTVQSQRVRESFSRLFEGVNAGPFARVLQMIANQLSESSVSGSALRTMLKSAFDEVAAATERVTPYVQTFFEGAILLSLKLYNALYPVRQSIAKLFGGDQKQSVASFENTILNMADNVGRGFAIAAVAIAFMIDNAGKLVKVIDMLISATPGIGTAFQAAKTAIAALTADMGAGNEKTVASGKNVADGVAAGITAGSPAVEAAMASMAAKGTAAFDRKMGIQSPSKVMQLRGMYVDQGLAKGVNDNAEAPAGAVSDVGARVAGAPIAPAAAGPRGAAGARGGGAGAQLAINIHERAIVIQVSGGNAETIAASLKDPLTEMLADALEKAAAMMGADEVKGAA